MAAAAFTGTLIFRGSRGKTLHVRCTMSDVAAASWVFPDGNSFIALPGDQDWTLVDTIIVTGGTDTTQSAVYANQLNTGLVVDHKSNLNTSNFRQFLTNPVGFKAGALLRLTQAA